MKEKNNYYFWDHNNLLLELQVQPKAKKDAIIGMHNNRLKVAITKAPTDGKANKELIKFFAIYFNVPQKQVKIIKGAQNKYKTILISNPRNNLKKFNPDIS